jgi:serine/threonine protein kinase
MIVEEFISQVERGGQNIYFLEKGRAGFFFAFKGYVVKITTILPKKEINCLKTVNSIPGIPHECLVRYIESATKPKTEAIVNFIESHCSSRGCFGMYQVDHLHYVVIKNTGDITLSDYFRTDHLRYKDVIEICKQTFWILYIFNKNRYSHHDLKDLNIMLKENIDGKTLRFEFGDKFGVATMTPRYIVLPISYELCVTDEKGRKEEDAQAFIDFMFSGLRFVVERKSEESSDNGRISDILVELAKYKKKINDFLYNPERFAGVKRLDYIDRVLKEVLCSTMFGLGKGLLSSAKTR